MALIEVVALAIGPAIAKAILKSWLGDGLPNTVAGNAVDLLKRKIEEALTQNKAEHQVEQIGQQVALKMQLVFEHDGIGLGEQERSVVAFEIAETLTRALPFRLNFLANLKLFG